MLNKHYTVPKTREICNKNLMNVKNKCFTVIFAQNDEHIEQYKYENI